MILCVKNRGNEDMTSLIWLLGYILLKVLFKKFFWYSLPAHLLYLAEGKGYLKLFSKL